MQRSRMRVNLAEQSPLLFSIQGNNDMFVMLSASSWMQWTSNIMQLFSPDLSVASRRGQLTFQFAFGKQSTSQGSARSSIILPLFLLDHSTENCDLCVCPLRRWFCLVNMRSS